MRVSSFVHQLPVSTPTLLPATSTNVYIIESKGKAIIIDAGYGHPETTQSIIDYITSIGRPSVEGIILTHYHKDHSAGVPTLQKEYHCPVFSHSLETEPLAKEDVPVYPDRFLADQQLLHIGGLTMQVRHAPGHTHGHIHVWLQDEDIVFTGDNIVGEGTTWIGPPDGDLAVYLQTLEQLRAMNPKKLAPGHGPMVDNPEQVITFFIERRLQREKQILHLLQHRSYTVDQLVDEIYKDQVHPSIRWVAEKTVLGHLIKLQQENRVQEVTNGSETLFALCM